MANYPPSAPFFGMPYTQNFQPQSAPPSSGPTAAYQSASQLPPLPPPPLPHHHQQQAQGQNTSGFQQNASLPPMDFQALGVNPSQLAALWQQVQNGAVPPPLPFPPPFTPQPGFAPPPPPPIPFAASFQPSATPSFPVPPPQTLPGISAPAQPPPVSVPAPNNRVMEIVNGDKEEGELSDEPGSQDDPGRSWSSRDEGSSSRRGSDRHNYGMPSTSSKPRSPAEWRDRQSPIRSPRDSSRREGRNDSQKAGSQHVYASQRSLYQNKSETGARDPNSRVGYISPEKHTGFDRAEFETQKKQAEIFLTVLHGYGYGYTDLQNCGLDPKLVKEVWTSLGFPLDQLQPSTKNETLSSKGEKPVTDTMSTPAHAELSLAAAAVVQQSPTKPIEKPAVGTSGTNKPNAGNAASSPADRAAYIARLMAAKNSKASFTGKPGAPALAPSTPPAATAPGSPRVEVPSGSSAEQPVSVPTISKEQVTKQDPTPATDPAVLAAQKKEAQNELLRRKIEALKLPKKKAEEEARAKAQAVAATISASRTSSTSGVPAAQLSTQSAQTDIPVRPAQRDTSETTSTPLKDTQTFSAPAPSPGGIPGLFMTAPAPKAEPQPRQESNAAAPANKIRKRPVASDFDDLQQTRHPAFKRPFGQSRYENDHEQMIIEVSDDETVGSIVDIDEADELQRPAQQSAAQPKSNVGTNRNLPPLTNFPSRPNLSRQGSTQSTPPAVQTPGSVKNDDLRRKEEEIAALKKKLAEKELQRRLAKAQSSRAQTPATPTHPTQISTPQQGSSPSSSAPAPTQACSHVALPSRLELKSIPSASAITPSASERNTSLAGERSSAPHSPADSEWRKRRRAEIQSGISAFDLDLNNNMSRLEQLRREMEQLEAENRRRQQEKESLINELEGLGIDTEGMPHEELQAKKDEIMQQQEAVAAAVAEVADHAPAGEPSATAIGENVASLSKSSSEQPSAHVQEAFEGSKAVENATSNDSDDQMSMSDGEIEDESDTTEAEMDMSDSEGERNSPIPIQTAVSTTQTSVVQIGSTEPTAQAVLEEPQSKPAYPPEKTEQEDDTEDFYSPEPVTEAPKHPPDMGSMETKGSSLERAQTSSESGEGKSAVAEEDDDDYAPPEPLEQQPGLLQDQHGDQADEEMQRAGADSVPMELSESSDVATESDSTRLEAAEHDAGNASSEAMDEGEDDYNPSDALPEQPHPPQSAPTSDCPTPQTASTEAAPGLSALQSISGSQVAVDSGGSIKSASGTPAQTPQISIVADDVAPELQARPVKGDQASPSGPVQSDAEPRAQYTPYESPLRRFKAYRYHPQYSRSVSGGYRSLTYSHEIDAMKPVCPYETAGGICNDSECDGQHFRTMGLSEDKILVQLGIVNPGRSAAEQEQWRTGLKQVLKGLREQNVKDAESVATAITDYRREFLQDPSRVLNL